MARFGENYIGFYCPTCGKGLRQEYEGVARFAACIRGHRWTAQAEGLDIVLRSIEEPQEKPSSPTMFGEQGYY